ncbi:chloramphenicol phosphotransferase CPT family protein [Stackebrandtia nassauensis]|uniref:Chloramphenicol phosphotransferase family protein n=1 Tax=Stackebrandtia nassauensis (strain DSM 44728 / CIP 108903 / NRRL B-16338 / NBRC 102104 / LLR-40K-21) TaxID=446470 RepID=D3Q3M6_STANL|nr:AAA family ATPase [Stackebrandtia nassauensis]ADD43943.1 Chloramphenicol phosphotransferase family protein [Stackebrandtia nassauensis DSM 44728]
MEPPNPDQTPGRVILLNGTTSSGKSSVAAQLLAQLDRPYFHMPVDGINAMRADGWADRLGPEAFGAVLERTVLGFHRAVAGMALAGNDVVMDHVLREPAWFTDCLRVFDGIEVVFVGVHCPLPELRRREAARGDREPGRAEFHFTRVHVHGDYDIECDTSELSPAACARHIIDRLTTIGTPRALDLARKSVG